MSMYYTTRKQASIHIRVSFVRFLVVFEVLKPTVPRPFP